MPRQLTAKPPPPDSYADVRAACHRYLLRANPGYVKEQAYMASHRPKAISNLKSQISNPHASRP